MAERTPSGDLGDSQIIDHLSKANQEILLAMATPTRLEKGQTLFIQHDAGDAIYIIDSGAIEISVSSASGKKLSLNVMRSNDVFGEIAALDGGVRTATATATEETVLLRIDRKHILQLLKQNPDLAVDLICVLCITVALG